MSKFTDFLKDVKQAADKAVTEARKKENMARYAQLGADRIRVRTRLGFGVSSEGAGTQRLPRIKDGTIKNRQRTKNRGQLSEFTTPGRSNLTETGELLDAIQGSSSADGTADITLAEDRTDGKSNNDIVEFLAAKGFEFFHLSNAEIKGIEKEVTETVNEVFDAELTKIQRG